MERVTEYFETLLFEITHHTWVVHEELTFRQIDEHEGYVKGVLHIHGGLVLHVAEYVMIRQNMPQRLKYRYQLLDSHEQFVARWDNAPHHKDIPTHPFHKHRQDGEIISSEAMDIPHVLQELEDLLISQNIPPRRS